MLVADTQNSRPELPTQRECRDLQDLFCRDLPQLCNLTSAPGQFNTFALNGEAIGPTDSKLMIAVRSSATISNTVGSLRIGLIGEAVSQEESLHIIDSCIDHVGQSSAQEEERSYALQKLRDQILFKDGLPLRYQNALEIGVSSSKILTAPCAIEVVKLAAIGLVNHRGETVATQQIDKARIFAGRHTGDLDVMLDEAIVLDGNDIDSGPSITRDDFHGVKRLMGRFGLLNAQNVRDIQETMQGGLLIGPLADPGELREITYGYSFNGISMLGVPMKDKK